MDHSMHLKSILLFSSALMVMTINIDFYVTSLPVSPIVDSVPALEKINPSGLDSPTTTVPTILSHNNDYQGIRSHPSRANTQFSPKQVLSYGMSSSQMVNNNPVAANNFDLSSSANFRQPKVVQRDSMYTQNDNGDYNDKSIHDSDKTIEGSGLGPQFSNKVHKPKLDDTEDSDDDSDDEDYDDKETIESGSGHNNVAMTTKKPGFIVSHEDTIERPVSNDFYKPFRPPPTPAIPTSGSSINLTSSPMKTEKFTNPLNNLSQNMTNTWNLAKPNQNSSYIAPSGRLPTVTKNKTETDYDYEAESEDDEPEDASVFEDNDPEEDDIISNKTSGSNLNTLSLSNIKPAVNQLNTTSFNSTTTSKVNISSTSPVRQNYQPPAPTPRYEPVRPLGPFNVSTPAWSTMTESRTTSRPYESGKEPSEEEDEEDEEDDEEEDDEEIEDRDEGVAEDSEDEDEFPVERISTSRPSLNSSFINNNQNSHAASTHVPTATFPPNIREQVKPAATLPTSQMDRASIDLATTVPSPRVPVTRAPERANNFVPIIVTTSTTTTTAPTQTTTTTTPIPSIPKFLPPNVIRPAQTHDPIASTRPPPEAASTPFVPIYYKTTPSPIEPFKVSPPVQQAIPPVTTNNLPYDKNISYNDDSLTRQIYDKAVEAYHEANKTVRAALNAVWPPNINLDSTTLEPLLAQPIFFMLALGGAIIGLVLLMMLVVYMITYQIEPRDDDISIY